MGGEWLTYVETEEARTMREAYNLQSGNVLPELDRTNEIFLPTSAGTVKIDLGELTATAMVDVDDDMSYASVKNFSLPQIGSGVKPVRVSTGSPGKSFSLRNRRSVDNTSKAGDTTLINSIGTDVSGQRLELGSPQMPPGPNGVGQLPFDEDEVPAITAEDAKARATRTAMLIGYAHRNEWAPSRQNDDTFDDILSA
mmetsp:Transcript_66409/g.131667  ORF Transcript_66409/g.131667 Transcript_66409/m.131667 type:complete len:197 (-) Transcript_66409:176-766(-)